MKKITLKEVILELTPFPEELVVWSKTNPEFLDALKNVYPEKFISPAMIIIYPAIRGDKDCEGDIVIGVYTYHHELNKPIFKQDFIVNRGGLNQEFILYSRNPAGSSRYVKDINDFFTKYGKHGHNKNSHHMSLEKLPAQLQERGKEAIRLAEKMKIGTPQEIPQKHIDKIYNEVMLIKREDRIIIEKLRS